MDQLGLTFEADEHAVAIARLPDGLRRLAEEIRVTTMTGPISADRLALMLGTDRRSIAASVNELILEHRLPIGSARSKPAGYYWIRTREELEQACRMYHSTAMELLMREAALKKITVDALLGQMALGEEC